IESTGLRGEMGASLALLTFLWKVASGKGGTLFPPLNADIRIDGTLVHKEQYLGLQSSTMDRTVLGLHTYWGTGDGPVRFTALRRAPRRLGRGFLSIARGVPQSFMRPEFGYRSVNAFEVQLSIDSGYTLDGELFPPGESPTQITLSGRQCAY